MKDPMGTARRTPLVAVTAVSAIALVAAGAVAGCAKRATLADALQHYQAGRYEAVAVACEEELQRWEAADDDVAAELPRAVADLEGMVADDALLLTAAEESGAPEDESTPGAVEAAAALRARGLDAGGGGGAALRALAADLFSDSPLRIVRATEQVTALTLGRLVPHLVANVFSPRPLDGDAGALAPHSVAVRMLAVKTWETRAVRQVLLGAPGPAARREPPASAPSSTQVTHRWGP